MRALLAPFLCISLLGACASTGRRTEVSPLEGQGELHVQLAPLPASAPPLAFEVAGLAAVRSDGTQIPLEVLAPSVDASPAGGRQLLARGRLEPGAYSGFLLTVSRASVPGPEGRIELGVSDAPDRIEAGFQITERQATVISLELRYPDSLEDGITFTPAFHAVLERAPLPQRLGLCSNTDHHSLTVFDKRDHRAGGVWPTGARPWGVAIDPVSNRAYVALSGADAIQVFDLLAGTELVRIPLNVGDSPRELALTPDRRFLVTANYGSNSLSIVDPQQAVEVARVDVGLGPQSLLLDRVGARAFVFGETNGVSVVDLATRMVVRTIPTADRPLRGQLDRAGRHLYLAQASAMELEVLALPELTVVRRIHVGLGTSFLKVDPNTDLLYVAGPDRVAVFDPHSMLPIESLRLPGPATWMTISDAENALFLLLPEQRRVKAYELTTRQPLGEFGVGEGARLLALAGERG